MKTGEISALEAYVKELDRKLNAGYKKSGLGADPVYLFERAFAACRNAGYTYIAARKEAKRAVLKLVAKRINACRP